jgi:hypothetical protein
VAQDRVQWRSVVVKVLNILASIKGEKYFDHLGR